MRINLKQGVNPTISDHWGINRDIYEYGDHSQSNEYKYHGGGCWAYGKNHEYIHFNYTGSEHIFFQMKSTGSDIDGGPKWEDWDGNSYGSNDIIPISTGREPLPEGFHHQYWGHPSIDRWENYILWGSGDPKPGTRITRVVDGIGFDGGDGQIASDLSSKSQYDGRHHAWDGWSDHVIFFPWYIGNEENSYKVIYGRKINFNSGTLGEAYRICSTYLNYEGNYSAYPRPSQSPDGTKVAWAAHWLNSSDDYPYLSYAVAYYPYPPKVTGAIKSGSNVRVSWNWDNDSKYTTRGWPDEATDSSPEPREIKYFHVWVSEDNTTWTELTTTGASFGTNQYYYSQPHQSTRYYAVTSEEHSQLESRCLSNRWKVTLDENGNVVESSQATAYPSNPGGINPFWTTPPPAPREVNVEKMSTSGHYNLTWTEPNDSKIRYYNIYYSTSGTPPADRRYRIASVPRGTSKWLDWCADHSGSAYYRITRVDRQGNEGIDEGEISVPRGLQIK